MQLIRGILGGIIIAYVWIWLFHTYFSKIFDKSLLLKTFLFSGLIVLLLFVYQQLPEFFWQKLSVDFFSWKSLLIFAMYCLSFIVLLVVQLWNSKYKGIKKLLFLAILFFVLIAIGGVYTGVSSLLIYYFVSVYAEEILKFTVGKNLELEEKETFNPLTEGDKTSEKLSWQSSNLIFIAVLVGFWFSMLETIVYVGKAFFVGGTSILWLTVSRGVFAALLHISATGLIAYFVSKNREKLFSGFLFGIFSWLSLHLAYNLSLHYHITWLTVLLLIGCYFILTYLLFNSDAVYKE